VERALILLVVLSAAVALGAWWRARDGRVVGATLTAGDPGSRWSGIPIEAADVAAVVAAAGPAAPLVLVEFTAPGCAPCAQARGVMEEVTADREDVAIVALDVGEAMELVRAHRIMRAPTTLLITEEGHLLGRVGGVPRREQLVALLDGARQTAVAR
jgi:thioredoxin-like negative regulator of GroEL